MTNLQQRIITSIVFVIVLLGAIYWGAYAAFTLFSVIVVLSLNEFYGFFKSTDIQPQKFSGIIIGLSYLFISFLCIQSMLSPEWKYALIPLVFISFVHELYRKTPQPIYNIALTIMGALYIAVPFTLLIEIAYFKNFSFDNDYHYGSIMGFFFILWANDTGSYFIGKRFGKHKLFERISPKKTWEGSFGGAFSGLLVGYLNALIFPQMGTMTWLGFALVIVVFGSLGDLVESMFKRSVKLKDSSDLLPGHGGILDRFDGIFISAPLAYAYLKILSYYYT